MLVALGVILLTFHVLSGGKFFQPTNMVTLAVQAAGIAIIATGMVMVIVSRNIDLSVGSLAGLIAMIYALLMTDWLPAPRHRRGLPVPVGRSPCARASALGAAVGGLQGFIIAYVGVPSFIVTLGGLLSIRGVICYLSNGAAVSGLDPTFQNIGGGGAGLDRRHADLGARHPRLRRDRRAARQRPAATAAATASRSGRCGRRSCSAVVGCAIVLGSPLFANANFGLGLATVAPGPVRRRADPGSPIILLIGVTLVMTFIANAAPLRAVRLRLRRQPRRRRAGRHQHPLDDPQDVRPDGRPLRARRRASRRPGSTAPRSTSARATSSTSSRRPSSAGRRSPAASGRSRAPSSGHS